jgi:archaeal flagellar protein FlaI
MVQIKRILTKISEDKLRDKSKDNFKDKSKNDNNLVNKIDPKFKQKLNKLEIFNIPKTEQSIKDYKINISSFKKLSPINNFSSKKENVIADSTEKKNKKSNKQKGKQKDKQNKKKKIKSISIIKNKDENKNIKKNEILKENKDKKKQVYFESLSFLDSKDKKQEGMIDRLLEQLSKKIKNINNDENNFIERLSFLDVPQIEKIHFKNLDIDKLYSKIDDLDNNKNNVKNSIKNNNTIKNKNKLNDIKNKSKLSIEEFEIPKIMSIKDDVGLKIDLEKNLSSRDIDDLQNLDKKSNFVDNKGLDLNPDIKKNIKDIDNKKQKYKKTKKYILELNNSNLGNNKGNNTKTKDSDNIDLKLKSSNQISSNNNNNNDSNIDLSLNNKNLKNNLPPSQFVLPKESSSYVSQNKINKDILKNSLSSKMLSSTYNINSANGDEFSKLIYKKSINTNVNFEKINDSYNIDDFTYVTIKEVNNKLLYNIVQPELEAKQKEIFKDIKKLFLDSIDQNYYTFRGDEHSIHRYIEKVYDVVLNKLSYNLNRLDKKLYLQYIENDFSGLGFLSSLLRDKNIIEVSCIGFNLPIVVYHIKYGVIETNLKFDSIAKLNIFVLSLTKLMGLHVNSNTPIINGYLPNGYKVEGLYSVGDISSKGSSFVIKKYLEEPLTPISLINLGVGIVDIYAYIWWAINNNYNLVVSSVSDRSLIINTLGLLYPNKQIISIQSQDNLKLPQKNWIKRIIYNDSQVNIKSILDQSISEKPDYLFVENFTSELFDTQWYNINLLGINNNLLNEYITKIKLIGQKTILIKLDRFKLNSREQIQINKVIEFNNNSEKEIFNLEFNKDFKVDLLSSEISVVDLNKRKEILNWMIDSKVSNYEDFNSVINDYYIDSNKLLTKLGIIQEKDKETDSSK